VAPGELAPEHPYPSAIDDALAAYRGLLATGVAPARIAFVGESAFAGLLDEGEAALARAGAFLRARFEPTL